MRVALGATEGGGDFGLGELEEPSTPAGHGEDIDHLAVSVRIGENGQQMARKRKNKMELDGAKPTSFSEQI